MSGNSGISWRADFGLWWPDYDHNPVACHHLVTRNVTDISLTAGLCKKRDVCVQAGGHAGIWPNALAALFGKVITAEPDPYLFACLRRNIKGNPKIDAYETALGAQCGSSWYEPLDSAGTGFVGNAWLSNSSIEVDMVAIDSLGLTSCDAIILDVEGGECAALDGARATIKRCRPILHIEILPRSIKATQAMMRSLNYVERRKVHKDVIYVPA